MLYLLMTAVDHLDALRSLITKAGEFHIRAPFSLIRTAVESSAVSLYLMRDQALASLADANIRYERWNIVKFENATKAAGQRRNDVDKHEAVVHEVAQRLGIRRTAGLPQYQQMIEETQRHYGLDVMPSVTWQICSAASHGQRWAADLLSIIRNEGSAADGSDRGRLTADETMIAVALRQASSLLERAFLVHDHLTCRDLPVTQEPASQPGPKPGLNQGAPNATYRRLLAEDHRASPKARPRPASLWRDASARCDGPGFARRCYAGCARRYSSAASRMSSE